MSDVMSEFGWLNGQPLSQGKIKVSPQDFIVKELLGYEFTGSGEHFMVKIRKTGENTKYVVNELAKACGVKSRDVSWAGLKDRHAVTEQWLSVYLPTQTEPDLSEFVASHPGIEVLATTRHNKKLRPGDLKGNAFVLRATEVTNIEEVEKRLSLVAAHGVPNYFGEQRFGHNGNNVTEARRWGKENVRTRDNNKRSFYLSAARSWIFNQVLSKRIEQASLLSVLVGDMLLDDNGRVIVANSDNIAELQDNVSQGRYQITGPLAGDNDFGTEAEVEALEKATAEQEPDLMKLIRGNRMRHERRALMLKPSAFEWTVGENEFSLAFELEAGSFATVIVRELIEQIAVEPHYQQ
ncbi:tRNA pseudouridine(13) synthase TruD [Aliivibrio kagoshimensis]|uniref:tRNA pseudouridine(13) synthase TruD n=1 Tax=Aliivibrio kagoshimensis TaxID=2910230 RepID=UPI003D103C4B